MRLRDWLRLWLEYPLAARHQPACIAEMVMPVNTTEQATKELAARQAMKPSAALLAARARVLDVAMNGRPQLAALAVEISRVTHHDPRMHLTTADMPRYPRADRTPLPLMASKY